MQDASNALQLTSNGNIIETPSNKPVILHMLDADRKKIATVKDVPTVFTMCGGHHYSVNGTYEGSLSKKTHRSPCRPHIRKLGSQMPCFVAGLSGAADSSVIGFYQAGGTEYLALQAHKKHILPVALERHNFVSSSGEPCPYLPFAPGYTPAKKMVRLIS